MPGVYIYDIMRYRNFYLLESWKNYTVSNNPEVLLYDFYLLSYLTTLPLSPDQKGFTGTLIGRDASEIRMDISKAENTLLPVLRKQLSDALFIAVCAEIRHILDRSQNWEKYRGNVLLKSYIQNYGMSVSHKIPREMQPRGEKPPMRTQQVDYRKSYSAVMKALKDTGSTPEQFVRLCADLFKNGRWDTSYGGPKWAEIAEAWILLNKSPQTNQQLQVAIDHAYDLQHNTGTVLNKVVNYYINGDITWLKKALDHKADLKNIRELMIRASSDMRKLALEAFKTAGKMSSKKTEEYLQDKVPGYTTKQQPSSNQTSNTENNDEISLDNPPKEGDKVKLFYLGAKDKSQPYYLGIVRDIGQGDYNIEVVDQYDGSYKVGDFIKLDLLPKNSAEMLYRVIRVNTTTSSSENLVDSNNPPKEGDMVKMYYVGAKDQSQPYYIAQVIELTNDEDYVVEVKEKFKGGYDVGDKIQIYYGPNSTYKVIKLDNKTSSQVTPNVNVEKQRKDKDKAKLGDVVTVYVGVGKEPFYEGKVVKVTEGGDALEIEITKILHHEASADIGGHIVAGYGKFRTIYTIKKDRFSQNTPTSRPEKINKLSLIDTYEKFKDFIKQQYINNIREFTPYLSKAYDEEDKKTKQFIDSSVNLLTYVIIDIINKHIPKDPIALVGTKDYHVFMKFKMMKIAVPNPGADKTVVTAFIDNEINTESLNTVISKTIDDFNTQYSDELSQLFSQINVNFASIPMKDVKRQFDYTKISK